MPSALTIRRGAFLYCRFAENGIQKASRSLVASFALMVAALILGIDESLRDPCNGFGEARLENIHALTHQRIARGERHKETDHIAMGAAGEKNQSMLIRHLHQSLGELRRWLPARILHQLDGTHGPESSDIADAIEIGPHLQLIAAVQNDLAERVGALAKLFLLDRVEHGVRRGDRLRFTGIGATETARTGCIHDIGAPRDRSERQSAGQSLRQRHHIGFDARMLHSEHFSGAGEAGLNLVGDQQDAVLVAERAQAAEKIEWRDVEPALPLHWLDDDCRNARWICGVFEQSLDRIHALLAANSMIYIRKSNVIDVRRKRSKALFVGHHLPRQRHPHMGPAVKSTAERDDS